MTGRAEVHQWLARVRWRAGAWWRSGPGRLRLRRRLLAFSAPLALLAALVIIKLVTVVSVGAHASRAFDRHDTVALHHDIDILGIFNVIEPERLPPRQQ